jgi:hypothetical protein
MAKQEAAQSEHQKAPYVTPAIVTRKVNLSFASSATKLGQLRDVVDPSQELGAAETRQSKAVAGVKNQT